MFDEVFNGKEIVYTGRPEDVKAWLEDPANEPLIGDTTKVRYGMTMEIVYAQEYLNNAL